MDSKNSIRKGTFYLSIINELKVSTNLSNIRKKLGISKQQLNYYLHKLKKNGYIIPKGRGWYELTSKSKNMTNYHNFLSKDITRGHAYVWKVEIPKIPDWENRIQILKDKGIHFNLVGAKDNTPRIKVLGRKVWLCNDNLRIFDKSKESYYGTTAKESRNSAFNEVLMIVGALNRKMGVSIKPHKISFQKEHYALIKNDLAIEHNKKGEIVHISDEFGEWLLIDDSLGEGGELENIGKKAFQTNIPMQNWWNDNKKHNFQVTPTFLVENINKLTGLMAKSQSQLLEYGKQINSHLKLIKEYRQENKLWRKTFVKEFVQKQKEQKQLSKWM